MKLSPRQSSSHIPPVRLCSAIPHLPPAPSTSTHTQTSQTLVPINTHICQYAQIHTFTEEKSQQSVQQSIHIQISRYSCANRPYLKVPHLTLGPKVLVAIHICRKMVVFDFVQTSQHSFPPPLNRTPSPRPALELLFPDCTSTYPPPINRAHSVFYFFYQHKPLIVNST